MLTIVKLLHRDRSLFSEKSYEREIESMFLDRLIRFGATTDPMQHHRLAVSGRLAEMIPPDPDEDAPVEAQPFRLRRRS